MCIRDRPTVHPLQHRPAATELVVVAAGRVARSEPEDARADGVRWHVRVVIAEPAEDVLPGEGLRELPRALVEQVAHRPVVLHRDSSRRRQGPRATHPASGTTLAPCGVVRWAARRRGSSGAVRVLRRSRVESFEYPNVPAPSHVGPGESVGNSTEEIAMDPRSPRGIPLGLQIRRGLAAGMPAAVVLALLADGSG